MKQLQNIKAEMDRVNLEIQNAERDYDLNHAAELKYGTLMQLQKQLSEAETALEAQACILRCLCMLALLKSPSFHPHGMSFCWWHFKTAAVHDQLQGWRSCPTHLSTPLVGCRLMARACCERR